MSMAAIDPVDRPCFALSVKMVTVAAQVHETNDGGICVNRGVISARTGMIGDRLMVYESPLPFDISGVARRQARIDRLKIWNQPLAWPPLTPLNLPIRNGFGSYHIVAPSLCHGARLLLDARYMRDTIDPDEGPLITRRSGTSIGVAPKQKRRSSFGLDTTSSDRLLVLPYFPSICLHECAHKKSGRRIGIVMVRESLCTIRWICPLQN